MKVKYAIVVCYVIQPYNDYSFAHSFCVASSDDEAYESSENNELENSLINQYGAGCLVNNYVFRIGDE